MRVSFNTWNANGTDALIQPVFPPGYTTVVLFIFFKWHGSDLFKIQIAGRIKGKDDGWFDGCCEGISDGIDVIEIEE